MPQTKPGHALTVLQGPRLLLRAPALSMQAQVLDYHQRNLAFFAPWDPTYPPGFFEPEAVAQRLAQGLEAFVEGTAYRFWLSLANAPERLIGSIHFSQVARGPFQNALLGYSLDEQAQGQGLMNEGLSLAIAEVFGPRVRLHRIQASVQPANRPSLAVLRRLGFASQGLSPRYLFINGAWRDHEVFALLNPHWPDDLPP